MLVKLRVIDHQLAIETGRHEKIPVDQRLCKLCQSAIENESHFLCDCPAYDQLRHKLYTDISTVFKKDFNSFNKQTQLNVLMQPDETVAVQVAAFTYAAFKTRKTRLDNA
jgi:hypothetical protein